MNQQEFKLIQKPKKISASIPNTKKLQNGYKPKA